MNNQLRLFDGDAPDLPDKKVPIERLAPEALVGLAKELCDLDVTGLVERAKELDLTNDLNERRVWMERKRHLRSIGDVRSERELDDLGPRHRDFINTERRGYFLHIIHRLLEGTPYGEILREIEENRRRALDVICNIGNRLGNLDRPRTTASTPLRREYVAHLRKTHNNERQA